MVFLDSELQRLPVRIAPTGRQIFALRRQPDQVAA
jgi:hypothetical protein